MKIKCLTGEQFLEQLKQNPIKLENEECLTEDELKILKELQKDSGFITLNIRGNK